jgi:NitT/TauT family transport system permease protein
VAEREDDTDWSVGRATLGRSRLGETAATEPEAWIRHGGPPLAFFLASVTVWQASVVAFDVPSVVLPAPTDVGAALARTFPTLLADAAVTAVTAGLGLAAGCVVGGVLAFAMTRSRAATRTILPYVVALRIAPLVAIAPLVFLWFGRGVPARALLVGTLTLFPMTVATLDGLRSTPQEYIALARSVAARPAAVFLRVRVPAAAPSVVAGLRLAATLSVVGSVVAEFVTLRAGLGYRVFVTADRLRTADSFAALAALSVLGLAFYLAPTALARLAGFETGGGAPV